MSIIKNLRELRYSIPTMQDFLTKGDFATVNENDIKNVPIYAFVIDGRTKTFVDRYRMHFALHVDEDFMSLVLVKEGEEISRYADYIVAKRVGYYTEDMWPWDFDDIGLSVTSGNISKNIIYLGTEESDAIHVRCGIHSGKRNVTRREDDLEMSSYKQLMRNVLRAFKRPANKSPFRTTSFLCLPAPKKEVEITTEVVII